MWSSLDMADTFVYTLNTASASSYAWAQVAATNAPRARAGMAAIYISSGLSFAGSTNPGALFFGGYSPQIGAGNTPSTAGWLHNSLHWYEINTAAFTAIKETRSYPEPRKYHGSAIIGTIMYVFGGLNERQETLGDMWSCVMWPDSTFTTSSLTIEWRTTQIVSTTQPAPRSRHATASSVGVIFVFGGLGAPTQPGRQTLLSDFWQFNPLFSTWTQVIVPGVTPTGRYAHSLTLVGLSSLYMYGGTTVNGVSSELWIYNPELSSWTQVKPLLSDSIWPTPVTGHAASEFIVVANAATAAVYQNYAATIKSFAANTASAAGASGVDASVYNAAVGNASKVMVDSDLRFLVVFGGYTNMTNKVVSELWIFDSITSTWSAPMLYSPSSASTTLRRYTSMFASADAIFIHGGVAYNQMSSPQVGYLQLLPWTTNTPQISYSFPWSTWGTTFNQITNAVVGVPAQLSVSQFLSLSPISFKAMLPDFKLQAAMSSLVTALGAAPTMANVTTTDNRFRKAGHSLVRMADSLFVFGGTSASSVSMQPSVNFASASSELLLMQVAPVCSTRLPTTLFTSFPNGYRQAANPNVTTDRCFTCARGSYADFNGSSVVCRICAPGTYTSVPGTTDSCSKCPAGFFYGFYGAVSVQQCSACPAGTYQPNAGASTCSSCPNNFTCPVLTTVPFAQWSADSSTPTTYQPDALPSSADLVNMAYMWLGIVLGASYLVFMLISAYMYKNGSLRSKLRMLDIFFFNQHDVCTKPVDPAVEEWRQLLITEWRTELGGIWSMFFFLISCSFISFFLIPYTLGNVSEKRSLVPLITENPQVQRLTNATFTVDILVKGYSQQCELDPMPSGKCDPAIQLMYLSSWKHLGTGSQLTCKYWPLQQSRDAMCQVTWTCHNCKPKDSGSQIGVMLDQQFSLAKALWWNISSTSGVGGASSSDNLNLPSWVSSTLYPSSTNMLFRGYSPSVISLAAVPNTFRSEIGTQPLNTGYLLQYEASTLGSQQYSETVAYWRGVALAFNLTVNNNQFTIIRSNLLSLTSFLAQLVGALSGLLTVYASLLTLVERWFFARPETKEQQEARARSLAKAASQSSKDAQTPPASSGKDASFAVDVSPPPIEMSPMPPTVGQPGKGKKRSDTVDEVDSPVAAEMFGNVQNVLDRQATTSAAATPKMSSGAQPLLASSNRTSAVAVSSLPSGAQGAAPYPQARGRPSAASQLSPAMLRAQSSYKPRGADD